MKTLDEINKELLSKSLDEYYLAIIENRKVVLSDDELNHIRKNYEVLGVDEKYKPMVDKILQNENNGVAKFLLLFGEVRTCGILTIADGEIYNIASLDERIVNIAARKIIKFDKLSTIYTDDMAKIALVTPDDEEVDENTVVLDIFSEEDEKLFYEYEKYCETLTESPDLTAEFLSEALKNKDEVKGLNLKPKNI